MSTPVSLFYSGELETIFTAPAEAAECRTFHIIITVLSLGETHFYYFRAAPGFNAAI